MKLEDITEKHLVKISPNSITVKDHRRNKTVGVITGIFTLERIPFREQIPLYTKLHKTNIPRQKVNKILHSCVFVDSNMYYFYDIMCTNNVKVDEADGYPVEPGLKQKLQEEHEINKTLRDNNIKVIECYIEEEDEIYW